MAMVEIPNSELRLEGEAGAVDLDKTLHVPSALEAEAMRSTRRFVDRHAWSAARPNAYVERRAPARESQSQQRLPRRRVSARTYG